MAIDVLVHLKIVRQLSLLRTSVPDDWWRRQLIIQMVERLVFLSRTSVPDDWGRRQLIIQMVELRSNGGICSST